MPSKRGDDVRSGLSESRKPRRGRVFWVEASEPERLEERTLLSLTFTAFTVPMTALVEPRGVTKAADGNLWFAETGANRIGRVTPAGALSELPLPDELTAPRAFTLGPDGNLWFAAEGRQADPLTGASTSFVARMTLSGAVTSFPLPSTNFVNGDALTAGPDGNLWFGAYNEIGRITTAGAVTFFATPKLPPPAGTPPIPPESPVTANAITAGPDGALWFTDGSHARVFRVTTAGAFTGFTVDGLTQSFSGLSGITAGPDGALWFTGVTGKVGRITTAGAVTEFAVLGPDTGDQITTGPDGNLWVGDSASQAVVRVTPAGVATSFHIPGKYSTVSGLTAGPDGNLWLTGSESGYNPGQTPLVAKISPGGSVTSFPFPARTTLDPTLGVPYLGLAALTTGPDGALWVGGDQIIVRVATDGTTTRFPLTLDGARATSIVTGPDGALWFTETFTDANQNKSAAVGRITTAGVVSQYPIPTAGSADDIVRGPGDDLWFVEGRPDSIAYPPAGDLARITPAGVVTPVHVAFPSQDRTGLIGGLAKGPDGNVWFTTAYTNKKDVVVHGVGRLTAKGQVRLFAVPHSSGDVTSYPSRSIAAGPDGRLWFQGSENGVRGISRISTGGGYAPEIPTTGGALLSRGPNHQVAFSQGQVSTKLLRATRSGVVVMNDLKDSGLFQRASSYPSLGGIAAGPDGNLWVTDGGSAVVLRVSGLDTPAGGLDNRAAAKRPPGLDPDSILFGNTTSNPRPAFAGVARPGAEVVLSARLNGQGRSVEIGRAHASKFDGSWTLTSARRLSDGAYEVLASQKGDPRPPSVLYSLDPDYSGALSAALVVDTSKAAKGATPKAATATPPHAAPKGTLAHRLATPGHKTKGE